MVGQAKDRGFSALGVGCVRWLSLSIMMTLLLQTTWFRKVTGYKSMSLRDWALTFTLGVLLFGPSHIFFYVSMGMTSEVEGTVLLSTAPVWTGLFSFFILKERISSRLATAIALSFFGAYIVAVGFKIPDLLGHTKGNLMFGAGVIIECFMGVIAAMISRRTSGVSVLCGQMWGGTATFWLAALLLPSVLPLKLPTDPLSYWPLLYLIFVSGIFTFTVWYRIVETTPLTLLVVGIALQPPVAALLNWLVKGSLPQSNTLIGGAIILLALTLGFGSEKATTPNLDPPGPA